MTFSVDGVSEGETDDPRRVVRTGRLRRVAGACWLALSSMLLLPASGLAQAPEVRHDSVTVDGARIHYREAGSGPVLLMLHGFTGSGGWWDGDIASFAGEHRVIVPDLPGHGRSEGPAGAYRYTDVAADLFGLMDALGVDRFDALGYSAGGILLLHMATRQPARIGAMTLVSAVHRMPEAVRPMLEGWPPFEENPPATREYWLREHPGGEPQVRRLIEALRSLGDVPENMNFTPDELSAIEARTLIIAGDRDVLVPLDLAVEMHSAIPESQLWIVPGHGHPVVWPDWGGSDAAARIFPDVVTEFLRQE